MIDNTSGHGECSIVPKDVKKWNWGAFWLTWIWGIGNRTYIALLAIIPILNIIMSFYLGFKGNELAWKNKKWDDVEELHESQKGWAIFGWIVEVIFIIIIVCSTINKYNAAKNKQEYINKVIEIVLENEEAKQLLGEEYSIMGTFGVAESHNIIVNSKGNIYTVISKLDDENNFESITLSNFGDENEEFEIKIIE